MLTSKLITRRFLYHSTQCHLSSFFSVSLSTSADSPPPYWTTDRVRETFVNYFVNRHSHTHHPSSPLLPSAEEDTLLFVNSGMVQFKPAFEGRVPEAGHPLSGLKRATNSQKCIRAGGKHNDLDDVGKDNYHHTFFEMLGSWSFGDYFKEESIDQAWELLTKEFGLRPEQLYATYFGGDEDLGIPADIEARNLWRRYLPESNILPGNMKDNFWEMGDVGPCGPCSELHYDRIGGGRNAADLVNQDDPDVLEIWNLVFMQYIREKSRDGKSTTLESLGEKHIDTGMGLERLASILQGEKSNYKIDAFQIILDKIYRMRCESSNRDASNATTESTDTREEKLLKMLKDAKRRYKELSKKTLEMEMERYATPTDRVNGEAATLSMGAAAAKANEESILIQEEIDTLRSLRSSMSPVNILPYQDSVGSLEDPYGVDAAYRVVADHVRTLVFALGDRVQPGNVGRGYVLRRIFRRGVLYGQRTLGLNDSFFSELAPTVVKIYGDAYPELREEQTTIVTALKAEEALFQETWEAGQIDFEKLTEKMRKTGSTTVTGVDAARLHQERGFPIDLTRLLAEERGMLVDEEGFEIAQAEHVALSKGKGASGGSSGSSGGDGGDLLGIESATRDFRNVTGWKGKQSTDVYGRLSGESSVLAISSNEGQKGHSLANKIYEGSSVAVALSSTGFYVESGGQVDDFGMLSLSNENGDKACIEVVGMKDVGGVLWHVGRVQSIESSHGDGNSFECGIVVADTINAIWEVNKSRRSQISVNHSATHLFNAALRQVVIGSSNGETINTDENGSCDQRGSLVDDERLRFDFSLSRSLTNNEINSIEKIVNDWIDTDSQVYVGHLPLQNALNNVPGIRAVFGESYPDPVRVVSVGIPVDELSEQKYATSSCFSSVELCGGTHVDRTSEIKLFVVCEERGIAKGVRRVSCLTGEAANISNQKASTLASRIDAAEKNLTTSGEHDLRAIAMDIDETASSLPYTKKTILRGRIETNLRKVAKHKKEMEKGAEMKLHSVLKDGIESGQIVIKVEEDGCGVKPKRMRKIITKLLKKSKTDAIFIVVEKDDGGMCYALCGKKSKVDAGNWVKSATSAGGGKGGGTNDFAQATGIINVQNALDAATLFYNKQN
jgi:alanine--tRNA ligase